MSQIIPLVNGTRHTWASIRMNILGRTVDGVVAIKYSDKTNKTNNYGAGNKPVSRGKGNYEAEASITLYAYEVVAIQRALGPNKNLADILPFDVPVTYLAEGDETPVTDVIRNVEFLDNIRDMKQGDTKIEVPLNLICSHIDWGI